MTHVDIEFSGMIAFDLRRVKKIARLLSGGQRMARHIPVLAIPRSAILRAPSALRRKNGWPQALQYGSEEQLLFDLTRREVVLRARPVIPARAPDFGMVWDLGVLNRLSKGKGKVKDGVEAARVIMAGGILEQGVAYPPFNKTQFALQDGKGKVLEGTQRWLTNSMAWSGDDVSLWVRAFGQLALQEIKLKDGVENVKAAVYSIVSTRDDEKDGLGDFEDFYRLLSPAPPEPAGLVEWPKRERLEGFPRCIPPVTIL